MKTARHRSKAAAVLLVVLMLVLVVLPGCKKDDSVDEVGDAASETTATPSPSTTASYDGWVVVTLVDRTPVFGLPVESDDAQFLVLEDAYYIAGDDSEDVTLLRRFGKEIHRPEPFLFVPWDAVLYREPLATESAALAAIIQFEQSNPATSTAEPQIGSQGLSAVFLKTGEVFFGSARIDGQVVIIEGSHYLRFKDQEAASAGEIESLDEVELVPQKQAPAGPTGAMTIPIRSILYMQSLSAESPVVDTLASE